MQKDLAHSIKSRSAIKDPTSKAFAVTGEKAAGIVASICSEFLPERNELTMLDLGAGSGRVAIPLSRLMPRAALYAVDVDEEAIEYLATALNQPGRAQANAFSPPLPFPDAQFEFVYSISVWSHFSFDDSLNWLREVNRILAPQGIAMITVAGAAVLEHWKQTLPKLWGNVTVDQFEAEKFIYREFPNLTDNETAYPGIAGQGSWGNALTHPNIIEGEWSRIFEVLDFRRAGMNGQQDIVILRKRS